MKTINYLGLILVLIFSLSSCEKNEASTSTTGNPSMIDKMINPADKYIGVYANDPLEKEEKKMTYFEKDEVYKSYFFNEKGTKDYSEMNKISAIGKEDMEILLGKEMMDYIDDSSGLLIEMKEGSGVLTKVKKGKVYKVNGSAGTIPSDYAVITTNQKFVFTYKIK